MALAIEKFSFTPEEGMSIYNRNMKMVTSRFFLLLCKDDAYVDCESIRLTGCKSIVESEF